MTTAVEVKRLIKPLLMRNSDLALVGRLLVVKPVHHILRGVFFDGSWDKNLFRPYWGVSYLFGPDSSFGPTWGERIYRKIERSWLLSDPDIGEIVCEAIERDALPIIQEIESTEAFAAFASKERFPYTALNGYPYRRVLVDIALGNFDAARTICEGLAERRKKSNWLAEEYDFVIETLWPPIVAGDRKALARMLHQWEAQAIKRLKLDRLWEPTPFPLELSDA